MCKEESFLFPFFSRKFITNEKYPELVEGYFSLVLDWNNYGAISFQLKSQTRWPSQSTKLAQLSLPG